jgi:hypothetical protein
MIAAVAIAKNVSLCLIAASGYDVNNITIGSCTSAETDTSENECGARMELTKPPYGPDGEETAQYIAVLAHELRIMAARVDLGFLAYLLAMVEDEATASVKKPAGKSKAPQKIG